MEVLGATDKDTILDWLRKDKQKRTVRKATTGLTKLSETIAFPFDVRREIEKSQSLQQVSNLRREVDRIEVVSAQIEINREFRRKQGQFLEVLQEARRREEAEKIERRREEALTGISKKIILDRGFRTTSSFAKQYDITEEQAETRLRELDVNVQNGRIIVTLEERRARFE